MTATVGWTALIVCGLLIVAAIFALRPKNGTDNHSDDTEY